MTRGFAMLEDECFGGGDQRGKVTDETRAGQRSVGSKKHEVTAEA